MFEKLLSVILVFVKKIRQAERFILFSMQPARVIYKYINRMKK